MTLSTEEYRAAYAALSALLDGLTESELRAALEDAEANECSDRFEAVSFVLQAHGKGR